MNELSMKNFFSCERQKKKTNVEIILSRSGKKNFIPFLFLFRNLLLAVQLPIHFRLRNYRNCSINRSERERERDTIHVKISLVRRLVCTGDISRVWEDQCFMELRNLLADVLPEPFLGLANCSAGVSTFHLVSKFDGYYDGIYKIEIQDLAKKCASVNY